MTELMTQGFLFPNEIEVHWSLMIVLYPYITGLVAGAFIVSSLYHVFGRTELKPVARFSLVAAFSFLLFACTPLLFHLGHPERAFNIMFTPKFTSAMSGFGYIYSFYLLLVLCEIWFVFRPTIIAKAREGHGLAKAFYWVLALGSMDDSAEARALDHRVTTVLAAIGIPSACVLHGYVGFLFGSLKSNPWWSTPLMPVIFLMSAIVSGIAILIVGYFIVMKVRGTEPDEACLKSLYAYLWGFFIIDLTLELLELLTMVYEGEESWSIIAWLLSDKLWFSYTTVQMLICSGIPLVLLGLVTLKKMDPLLRNRLGLISSALILLQVFAMRWNVVIGGQLFSKSLRGLTSYAPSFLGREGILMAAILFTMPFVVMYVFNMILPLWHDDQPETNQA
ncbi:MAG: polysulfide reductase NrfD [Desulfobacterota bacterium]|nr:polysulfide reductase NrfD [Thermodesulfobacteriota bacterium]